MLGAGGPPIHVTTNKTAREFHARAESQVGGNGARKPCEAFNSRGTTH